MDAAAQDAWMRSGTFQADPEDLLRAGRSGVKLGSFSATRAQAPAALSRRDVPLSTARVRGPPPLLSPDLADAFLDELFPAAQGVEDAGAVAYCLRYVIEVARGALVPSSPAQAAVVSTWRSRCGSQLQLLHLCTTLGVYRPPSSPRPATCRHFRAVLTTQAYSTPNCLVSLRGVFYDACRCVECAGKSQQSLDLSRLGPQCELRFDPRRFLRDAPVGWWAADRAVEDWLSDPVRLLDAELFSLEITADPGATGNAPPGQAWWSAEGPMNQSAEFCDMVYDWWPEDWDFPVGYHVTTPCRAEDAAYRSYVQAFALNDTDPSRPELVYQHDLLRDYRYVDSHFGVAGVCRTTHYGMPLVDVNLMRYCTEVPLDQAEDPAIYRARPSPSSWNPEACSSSSDDLPWRSYRVGQPYEAARVSLGTVPNMPWPGDARYPPSLDDLYDVGAGTSGWGPECADFPLWTCSDAADRQCPGSLRCRGRLCKLDPSRACHADSECRISYGRCNPDRTCSLDPSRGCLQDAQCVSDLGECTGVCTNADCVQHADCADPAAMCSGLGRCVTPTLAVYNAIVEDDISVMLETRADQCPPGSHDFTLDGGSYWAYAGGDLTAMHGMCSFENWFKYLHMLSDGACVFSRTNSYVEVDAYACKYPNLQETSENQNVWWKPGNQRPDFMFLRPTTCDRDYERLYNFTQCAPTFGLGARVVGVGSDTTQLAYDEFIRLHTQDGRIRMGLMPDVDNADLGFLGLPIRDIGLINPTQDTRLFWCSTLSQCYESPFTIDNRPATRPNYDPNDVFKCGAFGKDAGATCELDLDVLPLYLALCDYQYQIAECILVVPDRDRLCSAVLPTYDASDTDRSLNRDALVALFYGFKAFQDLEGYLQVTECMSRLHASILTRPTVTPRSTGLYYPFLYVLQEMSFDWFYQCIVMTGYVINDALRRPQDCVAFTRRMPPQAYVPLASHGKGEDDTFTYLRTVRGGFLRADIESYASYNRLRINAAIDVAVNWVKARYFDEQGADLSLPRCSTRLLWKIGANGRPYGPADPYNARYRALIANFYATDTCVDAFWPQLAADAGLNVSTWYDTLTEPDYQSLTLQGGATTTLIETVRAFARASTGVQFLTGVHKGVSWIGVFNSTLPAAYDFDGAPLPESLQPLPQQDTDVQFEGYDNLTCVFQAQDDPLTFQPGKSESDYGNCIVDAQGLRTCPMPDRSQQCTAVPFVADAEGKFLCRYVSRAPPIPADCTERDPTCARDRVMPVVYGLVLSRYDPPSVDPLYVPVFPWLSETAKSWSFDLKASLDYLSNIQPDPDRAVVCEINTNAKDAVQFGACNNTHYQALKAHVAAQYRKPGSVVVPALLQLEWPLSREVLTRGVVLAYASTSRELRQRFVDALFDDDTVCGDDVQMHICWKNGDQPTRTVNPWHLGYFNPFAACDVEFLDTTQGSSEYVYSTCLPENKEYCDEANSPFLSSQVTAHCKASYRKLVEMPSVPRTTDDGYTSYNLCHHKLVEGEDGCMHDQGLLGGYDGLPVGSPPTAQNMLFNTIYDTGSYDVAPDLYSNSSWGIHPDFLDSGIYDKNPLWSGQNGPFGFIRALPTDIGGHRVGVLVNRSELTGISVMTVWRLPLNHDEDGRFMSAVDGSQPVETWVPKLRSSMDADHVYSFGLYQQPIDLGRVGASCPLRRWGFYSGNDAYFSPVTPSPSRARHLFRRIHGGSLFAHPTMTKVTDARHFGLYRTSNGFCACPVLEGAEQEQCMRPVGSTADCSLFQTVQSLRAASDTWYASVVSVPIDFRKALRPCTMNLDWPDVNNTLRDGSTYDSPAWADASDVVGRRCHVLDRLQPFRYRYKVGSGMPRVSGLHANNAGACHTARVATVRSAETPPRQRCVRRSLEDGSVTSTCGTAYPRRARQLPPETASQAQTVARRRCTSCSLPPVFRSAGGAPMEPETSFGTLFRLSAERMVAKGLRDALCGEHAPCGPLINASAWRSGRFMSNLLLRPHSLLLQANVTAPQAAAPPPSDNAMWTDRPWIYCPSAPALRGEEPCMGVMTREDWLLNRASICPDTVIRLSLSVSDSSRDPMTRTPFCNLDRYTGKVCEAIVNARQKVAQANCIRAGNASCMPSPFVYHPASYEVSNDAWVHDTMQAFYDQLQPFACPLSEDRKALNDFARKYQHECPANTLVVVQNILEIVRVIATTVAMIIATAISMFIKIISLIFVQSDSISKLIYQDYVFIRTQASAMFASIADLLLDMVLNSGSIGPGLSRFLRDVCANVNTAAEGFLNFWCNYFSQYIITVIEGFRTFVTWFGSLSEIVNDFMDVMLQGILPKFFFDKYGKKAFRSSMQEKYNQPTAHKDAVTNKQSIPTNTQPKPRSRFSRIKLNPGAVISKMVGDRTMKTLGSFGGPLAAIAGVITLAVTTQEVVDAAEGMRLYPDNFTLFDLSEIINILDDFVRFTRSGTTCDNYNARRARGDYYLVPCARLDLANYENTTEGTTSIEATLCWADATPSLGQSSVFSCNPSSTCCPNDACAGDLVMCELCPVPAVAGVSKFGCDTYRRRCMCGRTPTIADRCSQTRQCREDSSCMLVSSMENKQYGSIPCAQCPDAGRVVCAMQSSGFPGECSCVMDLGVGFDPCEGPVPSRTIPDASRVCLYVHGYSEASTIWSFDLEDLIVVSCIQVTRAMCASVQIPGRGALYLTVGYQSTTFAASASRRLLQADAFVGHMLDGLTLETHRLEFHPDLDSTSQLLHLADWNRSSRACLRAVQARRARFPLGPADTELLEGCLHWRYVARRLKADLNLSVIPDTVLLSWEDLARSVTLETLPELIGTRFLLLAAYNHPAFLPVKAFFVIIANQVEAGLAAWQLMYATPEAPTPFEDDPVDFRNASDVLPNGTSRRRLLWDNTIQDQAAEVKQFSAQVIQGLKPEVGTKVVGRWSSGAFQWPPRYDYSLSACPFALTALDIALRAAQANKLYFDSFGKPPSHNISKGLLPNLPRANWTLPVVNVTRSSWASVAFHAVLDAIRVPPAYLVAFFTTRQEWTLSWIVETYLQCDLALVLTCSEHKRDLLASVVVAIIIYAVINLIASAVGFPMVATLFALSSPWFVLWYAFGVPATCAPLVPPCLLADVIDAVQVLLPPRLGFPARLSCNANQTCLRSCSTLGYRTWEDPLAFILCDVGVCPYIQNASFMPLLSNYSGFGASLDRMAAVVGSGRDADAHRLCSWINFVSVTPFFAIMVAALVLASALVAGALGMIQSVVVFMANTYFFFWT